MGFDLNGYNCLLSLSIPQLNELIKEVRNMKTLVAMIEEKIKEAKANHKKALEAKEIKMTEQYLGEIKAYEEVLKMIREVGE